jgi:hypothetical protein
MARAGNGSTANYLSYGGATALTMPVTYACWVNPSATVGTLVSQWSNGGASVDYIDFLIGGSNVVNTEVNSTAGGFFSAGTGTAPNGVWTHCTAVFTGSGATVTGQAVYVNAVAAGTGSGSCQPGLAGGASIVNTTAIGVLNSAGLTHPLNGSIAECAIWNVALTQAEITALAKGARAKDIRPLNLKGYWPLDGFASPEPDLSGAAHNMTITGSVPSGFGPPFMQFTPRWPQFMPPPVPTFILMPQIVT